MEKTRACCEMRRMEVGQGCACCWLYRGDGWFGGVGCWCGFGEGLVRVGEGD